jgi:flagellar biosynthesis/type III secretory pathway M-ring protein FliF/YscJ
MNAVARPWIGLCFKLMAVLAFIFAFIFFMRMQEEQSENDKLRNNGVVSRAVVMQKEKDELIRTTSGGRRSSGSTTKSDLWVLHIRHVPKSNVKYSDFPSKVKESDLPIAPPLTGDPMTDSANGGVMFVPAAIYETTKVGDKLTVVNTPWNSSAPTLVSEVEAFEAGVFYPRIAIALFLTFLFWFIGRQISKASMLRGIAAASTVPGSLP